MIASKRVHLLNLIFIFLLYHTSYTQEDKVGRVSVEEAISYFSEKFQINFSFADQSIVDQTMSTPIQLESLTAFLEQLESETELEARVLSDQNVVLRKKKVDPINCGYVVDLFTLEPIGTVLVNSGRFSVVTNDSGYFQFNSDIKEPLVFYHISYESTRKNPGFIKVLPCNTIKMEPQISTLNAIEVNNFLTQGIDKKVNGEFTVRPSILQIIPGLTEPDVLFTIQALPGISSINESVSNINIRGGTNDQNLILWDGIRMYQSGHFYGLISAFNPYFTEEVSLIKNGTSAQYGDAVSGTIIMNSIDSNKDEIVAGAGLSLISMDAFTHIPVNEKLDVSFASRRSLSDLLVTPTYERYFDRAFRFTDISTIQDNDSIVNSSEDFTFYDINAKATYRPNNKEKIEITFLNIKNELTYEESELRQGQIEAKNSSLEQSSRAGGINYSKLWSKKFRTTAKATFSSYRLRAQNFDITNDQLLLQENEVLDYGVELNFRYAFTPFFDLFAGYKFNELGITNIEEINNPFFSRVRKDVISSHIMYAEGSYTSSDQKLNARLGFRSNFFYQLNRFKIEPRITINYQLTDGLSMEILGEQKNQTTSQIIDLQNDFLGVEKRRWVLANQEDIPFITSSQVSAGLHYNKNEMQISIEAFSKKVAGIITSGQAFLNQFELIRTDGEYRVNGLDMLLNKEFEYINTWLSYSFAINEYFFPTLAIQRFSSNLDVRHLISSGATLTYKDFVFSTGITWNSGRPYTPYLENDPVIANRINYASPNSSRLPYYARIDVSGKYRFTFCSKIKAMLGFSVWNLLNKENTINRYYRLNQINGNVEEFEQKALELTPNLLLRVYFN